MNLDPTIVMDLGGGYRLDFIRRRLVPRRAHGA